MTYHVIISRNFEACLQLSPLFLGSLMIGLIIMTVEMQGRRSVNVFWVTLDARKWSLQRSTNVFLKDW